MAKKKAEQTIEPTVQEDIVENELTTEEDSGVKVKIGRFGVKHITVLYDEASLKRDFPTASELEAFVYDETGYVLKLKGKPNAYDIAVKTLNGVEDPAFEYIGEGNPHLKTQDIVPVEPMKKLPPRNRALPDVSTMVRQFECTLMPGEGRLKTETRNLFQFRQYDNGCVTFQVLGPVEFRDSHKKIRNKFGDFVPEVIHCYDPRIQETICIQANSNGNGKITKAGKDLRAAIKQEFIGIDAWERYINPPLFNPNDEFDVNDLYKTIKAHDKAGTTHKVEEMEETDD